MIATGSGSGYQSGSINNAADGSAGVYRSYHIAPEFTYTLGPANGLSPSAGYEAVLHFAGECLYTYVTTPFPRSNVTQVWV